MASCATKPTFKPLFMTDANSSSRNKSYHRPVLFPLKRSFEIQKLSCSLNSSSISPIISIKSPLTPRPPRPSFSLREGISSSLASCLSYWTDHWNEDKEKQKVVNEVEEEPKLRWDQTLKMFYHCVSTKV